ncbi:MAG: metallophosphoesterase [Clostridia bacterium]|nr:metallophosphoesterase [Clostridia bacterium]
MKKPITVLKTTLNIGIQEPVKLLHITDTHIALDDEGNDSGRYKCFDRDYENCSIDYYFQAVEYAKQNNLTILHTGDFLDFISERNLDFADKYLMPLDCIYAAGNHDFCHCVGKAKEDYEYKWHYIKQSAPHLKNNLYFYSRIIGGVNVVTLDDSYYLISDAQIECLKAEVAKGYPIVLAMHVPFYAPNQAKLQKEKGEECAFMVAAPQECLNSYREVRRLQQTPDEATLRAVEYIKNEPLIKAIITGHNHKNCEEIIGDGKIQITTAGNFDGYVREITII